jgi:A/G-specific adenine glycosylase
VEAQFSFAIIVAMNKQDADHLIEWFHNFGRDLPWRNNPTPYHVWLSEIMLQQTRVEAVKAYYTRFLDTLPDIADLAKCDEDVYLKLWQGLGYYSRVRNLHKGAVKVMDEYGGVIPDNQEDLLKIPGIGQYTSKAILSIAYQKPYVAVDGNLLRVFARLTCYDKDIKTEEAKNACNDFFYPFLGLRPGDFNQALMDLGELVCLPNGQPKCERCPFNNCCKAYKKDKMTSYPIITKKQKKKTIEKTVFVIHYQNQYLIDKRADTGLLASLYEFTNIDQKLDEDEAKAWLIQNGFAIQKIENLHECKHVFTHLIWQMHGYDVELKQLPNKNDLLWVSKEDLENKYSIPSAFSYFLKYLLF